MPKTPQQTATEPRVSSLKESMMDRYNEVPPGEILKNYTPEQIRDYHFKAVIAKIEELPHLDNALKNELYFHYLEFKKMNYVEEA